MISWFVDQDLGMFISHHSGEDLTTLARLMEEGKVVPVIDRTYPLAEIREAMHYLEAGRARGKVVVIDRLKLRWRGRRLATRDTLAG